MTPSRWFLVALTALLAFGVAPAQPKSQPPKKDPPPRLPTQAEVMVQKLKHAEALVKVVTLQDYKQIEEHAEALYKISRGTEFLKARPTEEYRFQAEMFQRAAERMAKGAREKNPDSVLLANLDMTKSCVSCHQTFRGPKTD